MATKLTNLLLLGLIAAVFFLGAMLVEEQRRTRRMLAEALDRLPAEASAQTPSASAGAPRREPAPSTDCASFAVKSPDADASAPHSTESAGSTPSMLTVDDRGEGGSAVPRLALAERTGPGREPIVITNHRSPQTTADSKEPTASTPSAPPSSTANPSPTLEPTASQRRATTEMRQTQPEDTADRTTDAAPASASDTAGSASPNDRGNRPSTWPQFEPIVEQTLRELFASEYDAAVERFGAGLRASLDAAKLAAFMDRLAADRGRFVRILDHRVPDVRLPAGLQAFKVTFETERGEPLTFTFTLNQDQQITGLFPR